ncbi:MAG: hypothetical protein WBW04_16770 [Nitrolancea sp.]
MTTGTKTRRPEMVVAEVVPERPVASVRRRQQGQYIALNGVAMVIIAAVALTVIGILYLMQTAKVAGLGYKFSNLQDEYYALSLENSKLGYQVASDQSLDKVSQVATQQLGMTPLTNYQFLQVQRPVNDNLPAIPPAAQPHPSLLDRVMAAITGESSASLKEDLKSSTDPDTSSSVDATPEATPAVGGEATPQSTAGTVP